MYLDGFVCHVKVFEFYFLGQWIQSYNLSDVGWGGLWWTGAQDIPILQEVGGVHFQVVAMWKFVSSVTRHLDFSSGAIIFVHKIFQF